jgi:hypothetical protein
MNIPLKSIPEGCIILADNIGELSSKALILINNEFTDNSIMRSESMKVPFILVIHAIEEAGKLLQLINKGLNAEKEGKFFIEYQIRSPHEQKGREAAKTGLLVIEWLQRISLNNSSKSEDPKDIFEDYSVHLKGLHDEFKEIREGTFYLDFDEKKRQWATMEYPDPLFIYFDSFLLLGMSVLVTTFLKKDCRLNELQKQIEGIANCTDISEIEAILDNWKEK